MKHYGRNDKLPEGAQLFRKKTVVEMVPMAEPFTCDSREHDGLQAQAGDFLVPDGHGGFYPVSAEFHAANYEPAASASAALADVVAERERQKTVEGWTAEHDDDHDDGELAMAAALYAAPEKLFKIERTANSVEWVDPWPWHDQEEGARGGWITVNALDKRKKHKKGSGRRALVIAAALLIAEIERLDRVAGNKPPPVERAPDLRRPNDYNNNL